MCIRDRCLVEKQEGTHEDGTPFSEDMNMLMSIIDSYRDATGTPDLVKKGNKRYFQIRAVLAYVAGDSDKMQRFDTLLKRMSKQYDSVYHDRRGKTEFRTYESKELCMELFKDLAEQEKTNLIYPERNRIAWDFLVGQNKLSAQDWIRNQYPQE